MTTSNSFKFLNRHFCFGIDTRRLVPCVLFSFTIFVGGIEIVIHTCKIWLYINKEKIDCQRFEYED